MTGLGETHDFLHLSTDNGQHWTDDFPPYVQVEEYPYGFCCEEPEGALAQSAKGIAFNRTGHTFTGISALNDLYGVNVPNSSVAVSTGMGKGIIYPNLSPIVLVSFECQTNSGDGCFNTYMGRDVAVDNSGTATDGTVYLVYTDYCVIGCAPYTGNGNSFWAVVTLSPLGRPSNASGGWSAGSAAPVEAGEASMVIDSQGTPYLFFLDYTNAPTIGLWEVTNGVQGCAPLLQFTDAGLNNPNWNFTEDTRLACGGHAGTAYCAFTATQVGSGAVQSTPSIYLLTVDLATGNSSVSQVNNDPLGNGKGHFNPAIAVTPAGDVYVSWFDNRGDPANKLVEYFEGKSADGGKTFARQQAVNDVPFDPHDRQHRAQRANGSRAGWRDASGVDRLPRRNSTAGVDGRRVLVRWWLAPRPQILRHAHRTPLRSRFWDHWSLDG